MLTGQVVYEGGGQEEVCRTGSVSFEVVTARVMDGDTRTSIGGKQVGCSAQDRLNHH
jgi:hypothetical protein